MKKEDVNRFNNFYANHRRSFKLQGKAKKTIDAYGRFIRRVGLLFDENFVIAFSCKRRYFCPSCHQKKVIEYGEWLLTDVLKKVPHRHRVLSIPKKLRTYFMDDRKLLGKLSKCLDKKQVPIYKKSYLQ
jgi:hypothetical protein